MLRLDPLCIALALHVALVLGADTDSIESLVYTVLGPQTPACYTLLNNDGPIGCRTGPSGTVGVIVELSTQEDVGTLIQDKPDVPLSLLMHQRVFTRTNLESLRSTFATNLAGVMLGFSEPPPDGFSPAPKFADSSCNSDTTWNPSGEEMDRMDWGFPMISLNAQQTKDVQSLAADNDGRKARVGTFPRYVADFLYPMAATTNSFECLSEGTCDPLGGFNVWGVIGQPLKDKRPIVLVAVAQDSMAFWHDRVSGSLANAAGVATVTTAVEALYGRELEIRAANKTVVYIFLDGEAWAHVGSASFVHNVFNFNCTSKDAYSNCRKPWLVNAVPLADLDPNLIETIIEVDQPAPAGGTGQLFAHHPCHSSAETDSLIQSLRVRGGEQGYVPIEEASAGVGLPPTAALANAFRQFNPQRAVLLAGYDKSFSNKYYHSIYDTADNVNQTVLGAAASTIADAVFFAATNQDARIAASQRRTLDVFQALLGNPQSNYTGLAHMPNPPNFYTSVYTPSWPARVSPHARFLWEFLANVSATNITAGNCERDPCFCPSPALCSAFNRMVFEAPVYVMDAFSPGLSYNLKTGYFEVINKSYTIWTESRWDMNLKTRFYMEDSAANEALVFALGLIFTGATVAGLHFGDKYYKKRFKLN